jgi:CheY-like chemotaxis protein
MTRPPIVAVAEPDNDVRAKIVQVLEAEGCSVVEVHDGVELLEYLGEASERDEDWPDLIVAEAVMPGLTGIDALAEVRLGHQGPPAILLADPEDLDACEASKGLGLTVVLDRTCAPATMGAWVERLAPV